MEVKETKYSYSRMDTYKSCPFKYKLQYLDGHYVNKGSIATEFGTAIHKTEELIAKAIQAGKEINYVAIKQKLTTELLRLQMVYPEDYFAKDSKSGRTYHDKALEYLSYSIYNLERHMKAHPELEIVGIEQEFSIHLETGQCFGGFIDRVFHDKLADTYIIQDIKTWAALAESSDLATPLQFVIYTLAGESLYNIPAEKITCQYYLPLVKNGVVQNGGTKGFLLRGNKKLQELFAHIAANEFAPKPSPLCTWCNFSPLNKNAPEDTKYLCPYHMNWTKDVHDFSKEME